MNFVIKNLKCISINRSTKKLAEYLPSITFPRIPSTGNLPKASWGYGDNVVAKWLIGDWVSSASKYMYKSIKVTMCLGKLRMFTINNNNTRNIWEINNWVNKK